MADRNRLIFKMEGPEKYNHHLELSVFAAKIKQFLDLLNSSAKEGGEQRAVFHIVNLSHSSPATMECEPGGSNIEPAITTVHCIDENLNCVKEEKTRNISHAVLSAMERLEVSPTAPWAKQ